VAERKSILRSFVKSVTIALPTIAIEYLLPLPYNPALKNSTCMGAYTEASSPKGVHTFKATFTFNNKRGERKYP
jgi:hypothetical protein